MTPIAPPPTPPAHPIPTGNDSDPYAIAITPDGRTAYVVNSVGDGDPDHHRDQHRAPRPRRHGPDAIAITPDGTPPTSSTWSGDGDPDRTATNTAGHPIAVGQYPDAIAITPDGRTAYVVNDNSDTVTPITTATNTAGDAIRVGAFPSRSRSRPPRPPPPVTRSRVMTVNAPTTPGTVPRSWAKVQIWSCANDASQQWSFTGGELKHGTLCLNDQGNAGNGGHVMLWNCNGASNEVWKHTSTGEYVIAKLNGLCLDDPASSTRNGTQLDVYRCHNGSNQRWSLP